MTEKFVIRDFLKQAADLLPTKAAKVKEEFEENLRPLVEASFKKLDLVTREEFDRHLALLERLQEKAASLEAELDALKKSNKSE
ncbi:MAG: accessory factor UbiK family protein [Pseudomonadales bacterium]